MHLPPKTKSAHCWSNKDSLTTRSILKSRPYKSLLRHFIFDSSHIHRIFIIQWNLFLKWIIDIFLQQSSSCSFSQLLTTHPATHSYLLPSTTLHVPLHSVRSEPPSEQPYLVNVAWRLPSFVSISTTASFKVVTHRSCWRMGLR